MKLINDYQGVLLGNIGLLQVHGPMGCFVSQ